MWQRAGDVSESEKARGSFLFVGSFEKPLTVCTMLWSALLGHMKFYLVIIVFRILKTKGPLINPQYCAQRTTLNNKESEGN